MADADAGGEVVEGEEGEDHVLDLLRECVEGCWCIVAFLFGGEGE